MSATETNRRGVLWNESLRLEANFEQKNISTLWKRYDLYIRLWKTLVVFHIKWCLTKTPSMILILYPIFYMLLLFDEHSGFGWETFFFTMQVDHFWNVLGHTVDGQNPAASGMYKNPVNKGITYLSTGAGCLPSTVHWFHSVHSWASPWNQVELLQMSSGTERTFSIQTAWGWLPLRWNPYSPLLPYKNPFDTCDCFSGVWKSQKSQDFYWIYLFSAADPNFGLWPSCKSNHWGCQF